MSCKAYQWKPLNVFKFCGRLCLNISTSDMYNFSVCLIMLYATVYNIPLGFIGCRKHNFAHDTVKRGQTNVLTYMTKIHVLLCLCKTRSGNLYLILSNNII